MLDVIVCVISSILTFLGLLGCIIPALPGPPLNFLAILILAIAQNFTPPLTLKLIIIMLIVTIAVTLLDYVIPVAGAKKYGSSRWGVWGSILGMIIGIIYYPPLGMIVGALLGAVAAEMLKGKKSKAALKAGWGVFVGTMFGMILKLIASGIMTYYFIRALV